MQAARPDISIIVVSHNTRTLTLKCIESLRQFANCEVVVVDTGSMDDTMASIAHCDTVLVSAPSSTGYAAAAHLGVAKSSGETLIVCNADTEFHPGSVPRLMAALAEDDIGIAAPRLLNPDGSLQQSWARFPNLMSEWTGQLDRSEIDSSETGTHVVSWVGGACIALKRDTWNALNGYNPEIMFYGEDTDLSNLLTVILPQSLSRQPRESRDALESVVRLVEHSDNDQLSLAEASSLCNREIISRCQQLICFAFHDSHTLLQTCTEAEEQRKVVTLFYFD